MPHEKVNRSQSAYFSDGGSGGRGRPVTGGLQVQTPALSVSVNHICQSAPAVATNHCQCMNGWMTDCRVNSFDKVLRVHPIYYLNTVTIISIQYSICKMRKPADLI
ncbi:hypothetical protein XENOCAPTIV_021118 [Xenoophorus captivus]|uniref:Uncharacterized protein n=1 Tax=Xenoophorus captivus TaxID=1517983 RepID=A0ABV0SJM2_9TELE